MFYKLLKVIILFESFMNKALKVKDTLSSQQEFNFESNVSLYESSLYESGLYESDLYGSNSYAEISKDASIQANNEPEKKYVSDPTALVPSQPVELFEKTESSIKELSIKCPFCKTKYIVAREIYNSFSAEKLPFDCFDCEREFFDKFPRPIVENTKEEVAKTTSIKHTISKVTALKTEACSVSKDNTIGKNIGNSSNTTFKRSLPSLKLVASKPKEVVTTKESVTFNQNSKYPLVSHDEPIFCESINATDLKAPTSEVDNSLTTGILEEAKLEYSIENYMSKSNSVKKQNKSQLTFTFNDSDKSFEDRFFSWLHNNIRSPWKSTLIIIVPIIAFLGVLLGITIFFKLTPSLNLLPSILSAVSVTKSVPAPSGLIVQNTEFNTVILENGETLYVISGKVTNTTEEEHKDVRVEGLAFNNKGELIRSTVGYLSNPLNVARIRSLSTAEIFDLQVSKKDRFDKIKPNESQKFTIVLSDKYITEQNYSGILKVKTSSSSGEDSNGNKLNGTELKFANYFSARVYSVGK